MTETKSQPLPAPIPFPDIYKPERGYSPPSLSPSKPASLPPTETVLTTGGSTMHDTLTQFASFERAKGLAETTVQNRTSIMRTLEAKTGRPLLEIDLHDMRAYLGRAQVVDGSRRVSAATRRTERGAMVAFYTFLHDEGLRAENPTTRLLPISAPKGEPRPFTREQIDAMLNTGAYWKTRAMILLGYFQGFRVSQIARVHADDIDVIRDSEGQFVSGTIRTVGKGSKEGLLPIHPVIAELAELMPKDGYWFEARGTRRGRGHITGASVTNLVTLAKKRAGILDPRLTPHSLRHAFGTDLVEAGTDIRVVQELMMHASLGTTQIYTGVSARRKREAIVSLTPMPIQTHSGRIAA